jgi:flagellar hook-associated protein 1 FlgK
MGLMTGDSIQILKSKNTTNQKVLDLLATNVANANIDGATEKHYNENSVIAGNYMGGVNLTSVYRNVDAHLQKDLLNQNSLVNQYYAQSNFHNQVQTLFGTVGQESSSAALIGKLADSLNALATNPVLVNKQAVVSQAVQIAAEISNLTTQLQEYRTEIDFQINQSVNMINTQLAQVAQLNSQIENYGVQGQDITSLQDEQDEMIFQISSAMNVNVVTQGSFEKTLYTGTYQPLVSPPINSVSNLSFTLSGSGFPGSTMNPVTLGGASIFPSLSGGSLYGLLNLRDNILPNIQSEMDQLTSIFRDQVNQAHNLGSATNPPNILTGTVGCIGLSAIPGTPLTAATVISGQGTLLLETINSATGIATTYGTVPLTPAMTVGSLIAAINVAGGAGANFSATLTPTGQLQLQATNPAWGMVVGTSGATPANMNVGALYNAGTAEGFSFFFGLNNLFTTGNMLTGQTAVGTSNLLAVNSVYKNSSGALCTGYLTGTIPPSLTTAAIPALATQATQAMADVLSNPSIVFASAGYLSSQSTSLINYAAQIVDSHSFVANQNNNSLEITTLDYENLARLKDEESGIDPMTVFSDMVELQVIQSFTTRALKIALENRKELLSIM